MTGDESQGTMGRVQTALRSFARTFSSKERRLGTRQGEVAVSGYSTVVD